MGEDDTRERLVKLEVEVENVEEQLKEIGKKVNAMHDVLMQASGAKWVLISVAALIGFVTAEFTKLADLFWHKP